MSKLKLTYTEAVAELETILAELENNTEINTGNQYGSTSPTNQR